MLPQTWTSLHGINKEHTHGNYYIMKKNLQNKKGLRICKNLKDVNRYFKEGYVVIQKYIDPSLINGRKTNLRVYLLITPNNYYYHDNMIPVPTNNKYNRESADIESNITNVGLNCNVYDSYPKNHIELFKYYGTSLKGDIVNTLTHLKEVCNNVLDQTDDFKYQLFGVDFLIGSDNKPYLLEVNSGPEMRSKCKGHKEFKDQVIKDSLRTSGIVNDGEQSKFHII